MAFSSSFRLHTTVLVAAASNTGFTVISNQCQFDVKSMPNIHKINVKCLVQTKWHLLWLKNSNHVTSPAGHSWEVWRQGQTAGAPALPDCSGCGNTTHSRGPVSQSYFWVLAILPGRSTNTHTEPTSCNSDVSPSIKHTIFNVVCVKMLQKCRCKDNINKTTLFQCLTKNILVSKKVFAKGQRC